VDFTFQVDPETGQEVGLREKADLAALLQGAVPLAVGESVIR
jgi:hypothetical protein